jgi:hypothetical protein
MLVKQPNQDRFGSLHPATALRLDGLDSPGRHILRVGRDPGEDDALGLAVHIAADGGQIQVFVRVAKGWVIGQDLAYLEAEGGEHNEQSWSARVERVLKFLFPNTEATSNAS